MTCDGGKEMAERVGFEPTVTCATTVFETAPINHSSTSPQAHHGTRKTGGMGAGLQHIIVVADEGIEPPTPALGRRRSIH